MFVGRRILNANKKQLQSYLRLRVTEAQLEQQLLAMQKKSSKVVTLQLDLNWTLVGNFTDNDKCLVGLWPLINSQLMNF